MLARRQGEMRDERAASSSAAHRRSSPTGAYPPGRAAGKASATSPKRAIGSAPAPPKLRPGRQTQGPRSCVENEVTRFLRQIGLPQYAQVLYNSGFEDMETLLEIEDCHMRDLGILAGHQVKLRKRLEEFDSDIPVVQIHPQQRCLGDWEDEDDAPPVRVAPSLPYGRGSASSDRSRSATAVQMSWVHLQEIGTDVVGAYFCRKIFELKPETMALFPLAVRSRYRDWASDEDEDERNIAASPALRRLFGRVVDAVGSAAAGLQDMNKMVPALTQLGMRHVGYNLKEEYFEISEKALLLTLREGLGDLFTKEVEFAWSMVYNFIIATMLAGFRTAQAEAKAKMAEIAAREPEPIPIAAPAPAVPAEPKARIAEIATREPEPIPIAAPAPAPSAEPKAKIAAIAAREPEPIPIAAPAPAAPAEPKAKIAEIATQEPEPIPIAAPAPAPPAEPKAKIAEIATRGPESHPSGASEDSGSSSASGSLRPDPAAPSQQQSFGVGTELEGGKEVYRLERHLQKAIFGDVYEVRGLTSGRHLAVKVTELDKMRLQATHQALCESPLCEVRFVEMMKGLDNVLQLEDTFGDDDRHYVITDLASGGDLMEALQIHSDGFQEDQAKLLILDAARGLASLHMRGLAMQDVTLENMLLFVEPDGQWQVRVCDPGQAVAFVMDPATGQEKPVPFKGLVADDFRPPELYHEQDYLASRVDSWCLGWNTFYLLTAVPLFKSSDPSMEDPDFLLLQQGRISQLFEMKGVSNRLSYGAKDFVTQLMHRDPVKRMPIKDALWHPWLKDCLAQQMRGESTPQRTQTPLVRLQPAELHEEEAVEEHPLPRAKDAPDQPLPMSHAMAHGAYLSPVPEQVPKYAALSEPEIMYSSLSEDLNRPSWPRRTSGPCSGRIRDLRTETACASQEPAKSSESPGRSLLQAAANWSLEHLPTLLSNMQTPEKSSKV